MAKNCVVSISPVSPYHEPSPQSSGSGLNAPGGCLSKPTTSAISAAPAASIACAVASADPPVAQPLWTLMNGTPVRPSAATIVSALPAASDPPAANSTSCQPMPASPQRGSGRDGGHLQARHPLAAPERVDADADDCDLGRAHSPSAGRKAKVRAPPAPGAGTSTSSIGIPMRRSAGSASVSLASTRSSPGSST